VAFWLLLTVLAIAYPVVLLLRSDAEVARLKTELAAWRRYGREMERTRQAHASISQLVRATEQKVLDRAAASNGGAR